jgi:hypothetical protein
MSDEVVDYADLYKGLANYSWENTNIEVMRAQFERCQLFIKTILFNSHFGKQGRHNKWDTIRLAFVRQEAMPFISHGTPHLITPEDWEILNLPIGKDINANEQQNKQMTTWHKKRLGEEDDREENGLKQRSILEWLHRVMVCREQSVIPSAGRPQNFK